jgi:hypothetical protein
MAQRFATVPACLDESGHAQPSNVPADERLGQPDLLDEIGHGCVTVRESLDDPEAIDVGERLVDEAELTELVRLVDNGSDGRPDSGGRGGQGFVSGGEVRVASTTVYINRS